MKVGHTLYLDTSQETRNATVYRDVTAQIEGAVLLTVAVVGGLGNLLLFGATAACSRFRTTSCAFLSHHCLLDAVKSIFCVPFACALLLDMDIPYCNAVGAAYIFLMTLTAYNLLAIHINEEYQLTDRQGYIPGLNPGGGNFRHHDHGAEEEVVEEKKKKKNSSSSSFWCVSFGIFMIWFTTVLIHLGVAFLPSSAEFSYDIGNCVFNYGTPKNYVIHVLWTLLVTAALVVAIVCFALFFCKLRARMHSEKWTLLHTSISREMNHHAPSTSTAGAYHGHATDQAADIQQEQEDIEELHYEFAEGVDQTASRQMKLCLRRVVVMLLMVVTFLLFWYPLFTLTILDVSYSRPPQAYRACMILAWTHPVTTPLFCGLIYFDMIRMETLTRSVYSAAIPLKDSASFSSFHQQQQREREEAARHRAPGGHRPWMRDFGFTNENFSYSNHGSPSHLWRDAGPEGPSCADHGSPSYMRQDAGLQDPFSCADCGLAGYNQHDTEVRGVMSEGQERGLGHSCSVPHSVLSEGQEHYLGHSCSVPHSVLSEGQEHYLGHSCSVLHSVLSEGQEHGLGHSCSVPRSLLHSEGQEHHSLLGHSCAVPHSVLREGQEHYPGHSCGVPRSLPHSEGQEHYPGHSCGVPRSLPHSILSEGQEHSLDDSCSARDSHQTLIY